MTRLSKLCARFLGDRGFSIGVDDVTPSLGMRTIKTRIVADGQRLAQEQITAYKSGKIRLKPGCDALQSLESEVNGLLGKVRENCGKEALGALSRRNAPLCMAQCGSKGSPLNISQMIACLGQQSVGGQRIQDGFVGRTLPHFPVGALYPAAKGAAECPFDASFTIDRSSSVNPFKHSPHTRLLLPPPRNTSTTNNRVRRQLVFQRVDRDGVFLPHDGRAGRPRGHRREDGRDRLHGAPLDEGVGGSVLAIRLHGAQFGAVGGAVSIRRRRPQPPGKALTDRVVAGTAGLASSHLTFLSSSLCVCQHTRR